MGVSQGLSKSFFINLVKVLVSTGFLVKIFLMIVGGRWGVWLKTPGVA
jgi:hypothetical protein